MVMLSIVDSFCRSLFGYHYKVVGRPKTWQAAHDYCRGNGGSLVTMTSESVNDKLVRMLKRMRITRAWIGYNDFATEGYWLWDNPSHRYTNQYNNWIPGEPNNVNNEDCAVLVTTSKGRWIDSKCYTKNAFICEYK